MPKKQKRKAKMSRADKVLLISIIVAVLLFILFGLLIWTQKIIFNF